MQDLNRLLARTSPRSATKDEARTTAPTVPGLLDQNRTLIIRDKRQADQEPDCKRFATLAAAFARAGFQLRPLQGNSVLVARWGMTRIFEGLDAADAFLRRVGGAA